MLLFPVKCKQKMDTNLDVLCVCCLQFLSEVRVCLQNLNHLSEVSVIVQASVLQECCKWQFTHKNTEP